jgi:hypothetical protein
MASSRSRLVQRTIGTEVKYIIQRNKPDYKGDVWTNFSYYTDQETAIGAFEEEKLNFITPVDVVIDEI